ncbi:MAG: glycosyltransferase [Clostridium chrysemydis]|uniref:glycosyltransferase n=1 Tax=Clostridium TaxID=1485 RepID=UPI002152424B|nr:glycosyltransferase [Clostridium sp. LY3-2]MCR6513717.1 glycosyltransferase [Clostridium sp. LY3-2]
MVILLRCIDLNIDPRVQKYVDFYEKKNIKYKLIGWNRSVEKVYKKNTEYFNLPAEYGGGIKNLFKRIKWTIFIIKTLIKYKDKYNTIHACDFDTAIPSIFMKLYNKKIVFDVFDWIDNDRNPIKKIIFHLQKFTAKHSDTIILCDEKRKEQIEINHDNIIILPNIPPEIRLNEFDENLIVNTNSITISYVGIFDRNRNIEVLLSVVSKNKNITLNIAGFGALEELIVNYSEKNENINYFGKVVHEKSLEIMKKSDVIFAMYCTNVKNHKYAAPNKYYEALMLGKAIITTKNTLVGNNVLENEVGFVIGEDEKDLEELLNSKDLKENIIVCSENAKVCWEEKYKNYVDQFMNNEYYKNII